MELKVGFWNIKKKLTELVPAITDLIRGHDLDFMCFAELGNNNEEIENFLREISISLGETWTRPAPNPVVVGRVDAITRLGSNQVSRLTIDAYYTNFRVTFHRLAFMLVVAHLPSRHQIEKQDLNLIARRVSQSIRLDFTNSQLPAYAVVGDLNLNPYDDAITGADGFNSTMDRSVALRESRTVASVEYAYTYNPTWSQFGDFNRTSPGSYFHKTPNASEQHWHTLDQLLLSPGLIPAFVESSFSRPTSLGAALLLRTSRTGNIRLDEQFSDHLPLVFSLDSSGASA